MIISRKNKEYSVRFRKLSYCKELFPSFKNRLKVWMLESWKSNMCMVWENRGFRILGIEFNVRTYIKRNCRKKGGVSC